MADDVSPTSRPQQQGLDETQKKPRKRTRIALMGLGVAVVGVGLGAYGITGIGKVSTEDAYVKAPIVALAPEVSGTVLSVEVADNQKVAQGQVLLRIDPRSFVIARDRARAGLDAARTDVLELKARLQTKLEEAKLARSDLSFAQTELHRQEKLAASKVVSQSRLEDYRKAVDSAALALSVLQREKAEIIARLGGDENRTVEDQPAVRAAAAELADAELKVERTVLRAPVSGVVGHLPRIGDTMTPGKAALSLVGAHDVWVEANFKETDLTAMRPGQPVQVTVDTYPDLELSGRVDSISQASGAEFSVLPPQNATGNWVKVVQRIPVRITLSLDAETPPLRAGMSVEVTVDTTQTPAADDGLALLSANHE